MHAPTLVITKLVASMAILNMQDCNCTFQTMTLVHVHTQLELKTPTSDPLKQRHFEHCEAWNAPPWVRKREKQRWISMHRKMPFFFVRGLFSHCRSHMWPSTTKITCDSCQLQPGNAMFILSEISKVRRSSRIKQVSVFFVDNCTLAIPAPGQPVS